MYINYFQAKTTDEDLNRLNDIEEVIKASQFIASEEIQNKYGMLFELLLAALLVRNSFNRYCQLRT